MFLSRSSMSPVDFHGLGIFDYTAGQPLSYSNESSQPSTLILVHTPSIDLREEVFVDQ